MNMYLFGAPWCGPCRIAKPVFKAVAEDHDIQFYYVDITEDEGAADEYSLTATPTVVLEDDKGKELGRHVGSMLKPAATEWVEGILDGLDD